MTHGLALIGAAFPRTGTMSVKKALEHLGLGRCYHMHDVFLNPQHVPIWDAIAAAHGRLLIATVKGEVICMGSE